ncbi:peptidase [Gloeobacter kilaueensis JS1]|uniref:Peptidase n=2 Tax=Gloeobacter TaxID=33071 RepID=U5QM23_GLOK1|nr:peptidase [Gloeobacter kilaueensis JS1]
MQQQSFCVLLSAALVLAGFQTPLLASQEDVAAMTSLIDPVSALVAPEVALTSRGPRQLLVPERRSRLRRPPRLPQLKPSVVGFQPPAPDISSAALLDSLVPIETTAFEANKPSAQTLGELQFPLATAAAAMIPFGAHSSLLSDRANFHRGIDLLAPEGTPVLAADSGLVLMAGPLGSLGNAVVLGHGTTGRSRYGHLQQVLVQPGQWVQRGTPIGRVGTSGRTTVAQLHFEYWRKLATATWQVQDPAPLLLL